MKINLVRPHLAPAVMLLALLASGCVSSGHSPDPAQDLALELPPADGLTVDAELLDVDGNLHIQGTLRTSEGIRDPERGHVDVLIVTPDGSEWIHETVRYHPKLRRHAKGGPSRAVFQVEFEGLPPADSVVQVSHHVGSHAESP